MTNQFEGDYGCVMNEIALSPKEQTLKNINNFNYNSVFLINKTKNQLNVVLN